MPSQGDRVFAVSDCFFPHSPYGCYAELASVGEGELVVLPEGTSFEEGAVVPLVTLTAWQVRQLVGSWVLKGH